MFAITGGVAEGTWFARKEIISDGYSSFMPSFGVFVEAFRRRVGAAAACSDGDGSASVMSWVVYSGDFQSRKWEGVIGASFGRTRCRSLKRLYGYLTGSVCWI